jgi:hypothetical protein
MRISVKRLVVAFPSTADAMAADSILSGLPHPGRLIPVPRTISAGCGYAWKDDLQKKETIQKLLADADIETDGFHECDFMEREEASEHETNT